MKIKGILLLFCLCTFKISLSHAANHDSITLTHEMIRSAENCPINPNKISMQLNCKSYHQTTSYTCGPAAAMMLMQYYGKLSSKNMNSTTELQIATEMSATKSGTSSSQMESWLGNHGFQVTSGERISTDKLIENIQHGIPILVIYDSHWILAKGYNKGSTPNEDEIIFADSCCNISIMSRETIDSMWLESQMSKSCGNNGGFYLIAIPASR